MKIKKNNKIFGIILTIFFVIGGVLAFSHNSYATEDGTETTQNTPSITLGELFNISNAWTYYKGIAKDAGAQTIIWILGGVLWFVGWLLNLAVYLFANVADANTIRTLLTNDSILETWKIVRDLCNIGFILILLFSAFSTVFQYSKYSYKNILLWLVIMALLVNFSFPITRFIIDISNVLMYTILNNLLSGYTTNIGTVFTKSPAFESLKTIMTTKDTSIPQLIASIIFIFILALTILAIAIILLIRTIALMILIIFSPIGFVGSIIGKGGDWWNNLFKYAIAGPIIALVLFISTKLMTALTIIGADTGVSFEGVDKPNGIVIGMLRFVPPIVILWIGIAMAVKGIDGAGNVLGKVRGYGKSYAKNLGGLGWASKQIGLTGGVKKGWEKTRKSGKFLGMDNWATRFAFKNTLPEREARVAGGFTGGTKGWKNAIADMERNSLNAKIKEFEESRLKKEDAESMLTDSKTSAADKKAAALYLQKQNKVDVNNYSNIFNALGDKEMQDDLNGKVKKDNNVKFIIDHEINMAGGAQTTDAQRQAIYNKHLGKLNMEGLAKQKGLHEDVRADKYLREFITRNVTNDSAKHQKFFNELNSQNQSVYADTNVNLAPAGYGSLHP